MELLEIPEDSSEGLLKRISFVETVNNQLTIFEGFKRELLELKKVKMGSIDFNMMDKNNQLTIGIAGDKEGHTLGMINDLKACVSEHKKKLSGSLNTMIQECAKEIEQIENDTTFSNPENLDNLDKDSEFEVINK